LRVKLLRHQPLLLWTALLVLLGAVALIGVRSEGTEGVRVQPAAETAGSYEELLSGTADLMPAIGTGSVEAWLQENERIVDEGSTASEGTPLHDDWLSVESRLEDLRAAGEDRAALIAAANAYNRAVSALYRAAR
jgi:hypothetical protein